ncbi:MAG: EF-P lysine aminoacylase EpmA [Thalassolituus sp.]
MSLWQPSCDRDALRARSLFYQQIRAFFAQRDVLEVDTPILAAAPVTDPNIEPMQTIEGRWLHTSPEYAMKRLLCAGSGDIWQLCKVFRAGEAGSKHNPEFSMLEWYRVGWDHHQLMDEVRDLVRVLFQPRWQNIPEMRLSYAQAFTQYAGLDVHHVHDDVLHAKGIELAGQDLELNRDGWLDIIMSHLIEPSLPTNTLVFIDAFPASQAALAKITHEENDIAVAQRFELFFNGTELANGYHELTDAAEQRRRFNNDARVAGGRKVDERLLEALESGLPECAGVAMGIDRLLMHSTGATCISEVLAFDWHRS